MVKSIVLILLLVNGDIVLKEIKFDGTLMECLAHGDTLREELSEYKEFGLSGKAIDQMVPEKWTRNLSRIFL